MQVYVLLKVSQKGNRFIMEISTDEEELFEKLKVNFEIYKKAGFELKIMIAEMFMTGEESDYEK